MLVQVKPKGFIFEVIGYSEEREPWIGTLLTLANGRIGVRNEFELAGSRGNYVLMHGLYNDIPIWRREIVALPSINNAYLIPMDLRDLTYLQRNLDMYNGILSVKARFNNGVEYYSEHLAHRKLKNLYSQKILVKSPNEVKLIIPIEFSLNPFLYGYTWTQHLHAEEFNILDDRIIITYKLRGKDRRVRVGTFIETHEPYDIDTFITRDSAGFLIKGKNIEVAKHVIIESEIGSLENVDAIKWESIRSDHVKAWSNLWEDIGLEIQGDEEIAGKILFYTYHLLQLIDESADELIIPARGLHGIGYRGHVFWDTDIYLLPFMALVVPDAIEKIVRYRYRTLKDAKENAFITGYEGARYAWESVDDGKESTPRYYPLDLNTCKCVDILTGEKEIHIIGDVSLAVDFYYIASGDEEFLAKYGLEIMVETARFWASKARFDQQLGKYVIEDVIGPDEYHVGVNNDYYTNFVATYNLKRAYEIATKFLINGEYREIINRLGLSQDEIKRWYEISKNLYQGRKVNGIIEQFNGYFDLPHDLELPLINIHRSNIDSLHEISRTRLIKQPDVVLALILQEVLEGVDRDLFEKNYEYYLKRTTHESSLSMPIYSAAAFVLDKKEAFEIFEKTLDTDIGNIFGNSHEGFHVATAGGIWWAILFGILGLRIRGGELAFDPRPVHGLKITLNIRWRGNKLRISNEPE